VSRRKRARRTPDRRVAATGNDYQQHERIGIPKAPAPVSMAPNQIPENLIDAGSMFIDNQPYWSLPPAVARSCPHMIRHNSGSYRQISSNRRQGRKPTASDIASALERSWRFPCLHKSLRQGTALNNIAELRRPLTQTRALDQAGRPGTQSTINFMPSKFLVSAASRPTRSARGPACLGRKFVHQPRLSFDLNAAAQQYTYLNTSRKGGSGGAKLNPEMVASYPSLRDRVIEVVGGGRGWC